MTLLALTGGETAPIVLAAFWGLLVLFRAPHSVDVPRARRRPSVGAMREETVPLLRGQGLRGAHQRASRSRGWRARFRRGVVGRVERFTGLLEHAASSPIVKFLSVGAGVKKAADSFSKKRSKGSGARRAGPLTCAAASGSRSALGAGATAAVVASRWARRQANKVKPATLAREARGGLMDAKLVAESIEEGKRAMEERERELRAELDASKRDPGPDEPTAA